MHWMDLESQNERKTKVSSRAGTGKMGLGTGCTVDLEVIRLLAEYQDVLCWVKTRGGSAWSRSGLKLLRWFSTSLWSIALGQRSAHLFSEGQMVNILSFASQLLKRHCSGKAASDNT